MKTRTIRTKILSLLLAAIMVFSLLPVTALAATVDNNYTPGTYTGTAWGYKSDVTITVTLAKDEEGAVKISEITAKQEETEGLWVKAVALLDTIKENNGTDGVDAVSGATKSSNAIIKATDEALSKAFAGFVDGTGAQNDPYLISSEAGLRYLQAQVASGKTYAGQYIKLTSDIALTGEWTPIGSSATYAFAGSFDGNGHTISGMTVTDSSLGYVGLFGYTLNGVAIKNVKLTDVNINMPAAAQSVYAAALVGFIKVNGSGTASSVIDNCFASGRITVKNTDKITVVGGLAGFTDQRAAVTNCGTNVDINADSGTQRATIGGLVAWASIQALFMNDYALGNVTAATEHDTYGNVGGLFGQVNGIVYNVYSAGTVTLNTSKTAYKAGELAGDLAAATYADSCYYSGSGDAFGKGTGSYNSENVVSKAGEIGTQAFADVLHNNLAPAALTAMAERVKNAKVTGCTDFNAMAARVNDKFYDWTVSGNAVVLASTLWSSAEVDASIFASGTGTEADPYVIKTADQLRAFAGSMNDKIDYTNKYVKLDADIDVSGEEWQPIGGSEYLFNGTFDGAGHTISSMTLGSAEKAFALDKENLYIGLFGVLNSNAVVKNVKVDVAFYTSYEATAFVGGIVGATQGSRTNDYTGAVIDGCYVSGTISHVGTKGNQNVGGIIGMQYKGALINSAAEVKLSSVVSSGDLAEAGGLVGLNNRGLVANCWSDSTIYGSGNRENDNEGMAVVSNLIACNAGALVNCYASGDLTTKEQSTYAGMVSGWVTGIGKSYNCWYNLNSTMTVDGRVFTPVSPIGTKVPSGVNDEGDAYTGGLVDKMTGVEGTSKAVADALNASFEKFPIDITAFGVENSSLKTWVFDSDLDFGSESANVTYVKPDCETVVKPAAKLNDGVWYGRDADKTTVVSIEVKDNAIEKTTVISGDNSGDAYDAAVEKAKNKATYGDFSHYYEADPSNFAGGSGTAEDPYLIANAEQLEYLSSSINADVSWKGVYFKQTADITLDGQWQPIGWALNGEVNGKKTQICAYPFRGNYDGGGYSISGLAIGSEDKPADMWTAGLFGLTAGELTTNDVPTGSEQTVTIKNVNLKNIYINVSTRYETAIGGLVGFGQYGIYIDNCTVSGEINSTTSESFSRAGGLGGNLLRGSITNCAVDVDISAVTDASSVYAGGLYAMDNRTTTYNCYALGDVSGKSTNPNKVYVGGLVGQAGGMHYNCYVAGNVISLIPTKFAGAITGNSGGIAVDRNCYFNSEITLKQGDTVVSPVIALGQNANNNAVVSNVVGKTAAELKSAEFAKLLTSNLSKAEMEESQKIIEAALADQAGRGFTQVNYYTGNELFGWTADGSSYAGFCKHVDTVVTDEAVAATCTKTGLTEGTHCSDCGMVLIVQEEVSMIDHTFENGKCTVCGADDPDYNPPRPVHHHTVVVDAAVAATCTESGLTEGSHCSTCNAVLVAQEVIPALGHKTELKNVKAATCTEAGYTGDKVCSVCGATVEKGSEIAALGHKFSDGVCSACGEKDPTYNPFNDVKKGAFYYDAVLWAVENEVTAGTTDTTFSPNDGCTRAQIVTFLYRAAGSPKVENAKNPFSDVSKDSVYYDAIMWAVSEGITAGTTATTFSPNAVCTRAQIVSFLYRASGDAKVKSSTQFTDVPANAWYAEAVAWAVENGITAGTTATTFSPNATCTRAQAVTLIYRAQ